MAQVVRVDDTSTVSAEEEGRGVGLLGISFSVRVYLGRNCAKYCCCYMAAFAVLAGGAEGPSGVHCPDINGAILNRMAAAAVG